MASHCWAASTWTTRLLSPSTVVPSGPSVSTSTSMTPGRCSSTFSIAAGSMTRPRSVSTVVRPSSRSARSSTVRAIGPSASRTPSRTVAARTGLPRLVRASRDTTGTRLWASA
ncbi:hypothetical protein [Blastococcus brunescens]|uniref:Uncharacterized protein n=1 Tax=Blastococcus brunescens TaxID=1564165 RepID=A0ABZ1AU89_9ACTN|nr:hypothetical protein [Blastococcus sp. BMG 8361]WRL62139.1 hypothetical protein U6N30_19035 [Blastococcus sp. BMG 8361]